MGRMKFECVAALCSGSIVVRVGEIVDGDHPAVELMPSAFVKVAGVEQATAAPGEKRSLPSQSGGDAPVKRGPGRPRKGS